MVTLQEGEKCFSMYLNFGTQDQLCFLNKQFISIGVEISRELVVPFSIKPL